MAIARHPSKHDLIRKIDPLPYRTQKAQLTFEFQDESAKEAISRALTKISSIEGICGFVVGWPLEPSGFPGSRCGQVLHLLDHLVEIRHEGKYMINGNSRPVVLWDERSFTHQTFEDKTYPLDAWGRSEIFGKKTTALSPNVKKGTKHLIYKTSLRSDPPTSDDSTVASLILEQFLHHHFGDHTNESDLEQFTGDDCHRVIDQIERNGNYFQSLLS